MTNEPPSKATSDAKFQRPLYSLLFLVAGFYSVFPAYLVLNSGYEVLEGWQSTRWPTVAGTVNSGNISAVRLPDKFIPSLRYTYETPGRNGAPQKHTAYSISAVDDDVLPKSEAESMMKPFAPGATVTVHYNPDEPERSVLVTGPQASSIKATLEALLFLLPGVIALGLSAWKVAFSSRARRA